MPDENINSVVDHAFSDNAVEMRNALYNAINDKIFAALEQRKQEVAQNFLAQYDADEEDAEEDAENYEQEETIETAGEESESKE